ncbi:unnamed protein product, partial [Ectocarpus sp. 8 AP-2014]
TTKPLLPAVPLPPTPAAADPPVVVVAPVFDRASISSCRCRRHRCCWAYRARTRGNTTSCPPLWLLAGHASCGTPAAAAAVASAPQQKSPACCRTAAAASAAVASGRGAEASAERLSRKLSRPDIHLAER